MPNEETFLFPLKYVDVTRAAHTNLDVLQEKRIDHFWNVDANRSLSDSWKGFTKFALLKEKPSEGYIYMDMFPEPTELLLIGYLFESIWTPNQIH